MERKAYNASSLLMCEARYSGGHSVSFGIRFGKLDLMSRSVRRVVVRSRSFVRSKSREAYATRVQECESIRPRSDDEQEKGRFVFRVQLLDYRCRTQEIELKALV